MLRPLAILTTCIALLSAVAVEDLPVRAGDLALTGRLALPDGADRRPAVLVVHEWWGRNAYAERRARELAEAGYVALAADCFGQEPTADVPTAAQRSAPFYKDPELFARRLAPALAALRGHPRVDGQRIAAIGFCFGGSAVLQLARGGEDLRAVVAFHPGLKTARPATAGAVKARILVCHGGADPFVPVDDVAAFAREMLAAQAPWQLLSLPGAVHAFTNPEAGQGATNAPAGFAQAVRYDAVAEQTSMAAMRALLLETLGR